MTDKNTDSQPSIEQEAKPRDSEDSNSVLSYAANVDQIFTGEVNPQTGQYIFQVSLLNAVANNQLGPELTLNLTFNQQSSADVGFGPGLFPNLTSLDLEHDLLTLFSGESIKFDLYSLDIGEEASVLDARVSDLTLIKTGSEQFEVHYKTGEVEVLEPIKSGEDIFYIKERFSSADKNQQRKISYSYNNYLYLEKIKDGNDIIWFERNEYPSYTHKLLLASGRLAFHIHDDDVLKLSKPDSPDASIIWSSLESDEQQGVPLRIEKVNYYYGRVDELTYRDEPLDMPVEGDDGVGLPAVEKIEIKDPHQGDAVLSQTNYDYNPLNDGHNHLGAQADSSYADYDANSDYLCNVKGEYYYAVSTTELSLDKSAPDRLTINTYDKYHNLITSEVSSGGCVETTTTDYFLGNSGYDVLFSDQDVRCNLPRRQVVSYKDTAGSRSQAITFEYDTYGNMLSQFDEQTSIQTDYIYYSAEGEQGCPAYEFVHFAKVERIWHPTDRLTQTTHYTYQLLVGSDSTVFPLSETFVEGNQTITYGYDADGRIQEQVINLNGHLTTSSYRYIVADEAVQQAGVLTTSGETGESFISNLHLDVLTGATLHQERQSLGITRIYYPDGRVHTETVDKDGAYESSKTYTYQDNEHTGTVTDAAGTQILSRYDALSRPVKRYLTLPSSAWDSINGFLMEERQYNGLGQCTDGRQYDVLHADDPTSGEQGELSLSASVSYDGWGNKTITYPDRVEQEVESPVTQISYQRVVGQSYETTQLSDDQRTQTITYCDADGTHLIQEVQRTDSFGRAIYMADRFGGESELYYDAFDRLVLKRYNDQEVRYDYSLQTSDALISQIRVNFRTVGLQTYDGFGRLISTGVGARQLGYDYRTGEMYAYQRQLPNAQIQALTYVPAIQSYKTIDDQAFEFDALSGLCTQATKGGQTSTLTYRFDGLPLTEQDNDHSLTYWYSLLGKPTAIVSDSGLVQTSIYNPQGQIETVKTQFAGTPVTSTEYEYDVTGRPQMATTTHNNETQIKTINWDDYPLSLTVTTSLSNQAELTELLTFNPNSLLASRTSSLGGNQHVTESYIYDNFGRLTEWSVEGELAPIDAQGRRLSHQHFEHDAFNNLKKMVTSFIGDENDETREHHYADKSDPCLLTQIDIKTGDGPISDWFIPEYDDFGNMTNDEKETLYQYNNQGLLSSATPLGEEATAYLYDALGRLSQITPPDEASLNRHYSSGALLFEQQGDYLRHYQRHVGEKVVSHCVFNLDDNSLVQQAWYQSNAQGSPVQSIISGDTSHLYSYTTFGEQYEITNSTMRQSK
ncbi:hypothetical protein HQQ94_18915 [Shewanella sp. VB17]|uniref:RHS repeat domain-containing protein n=1 Tax=Shewanella sp. VB17 TaxID=2739432 RepID=UPI0015637129|nr:hypothetical protein [Shewanella sp. VB17]NRD75254.1 hypothetical protein [Shewanella sp. VB17]